MIENVFQYIYMCKKLAYSTLQPPAMPRSPQTKRARWLKADLVSGENVLESYNLTNDAGMCVESGRVAACVVARDECSCAPHWPACLHSRLPCEMSKLLACLRWRLIARERGVAVRLAATYMFP